MNAQTLFHSGAASTLEPWHTKIRAEIFVDKCAIDYLSVSWPTTRPEVSEPLWNLLPFLGSRNYSITVSAMVALEVAKVLYTGRCVGKFFYEWRGKPLPRKASEFLYAGTRSKSIRILPPPDHRDQSNSAQYTREVYNICACRGDDVEKQRRIDQVRRKFARIKDLGDESVQQHISYMGQTDVPIFYLSDDCGALSKALKVASNKRPDLNVHALPLRNFIGALLEHNIISMANFEQQPLNSFADAMATNPMNGERPRRLLNSPEHVNDKNQHAFGDTLARFGEAETYEEISLPDNEEPRGLTRIEKFNNRLRKANPAL